MLVVSLCKPVIRKLKMLGGGKLEYCKSMGRITKKGGTKFWDFSGEKQKEGDTIFDSNLAGGILEETMFSFTFSDEILNRN